MRVVIADPQAKVRSALRLLLEQHLRLPVSGEAGTAEELLRLTGAACPDLVLLDLMLPGIDGMEVCRRLKQDPETRDIPVIIISAKGDESDIVAGLELDPQTSRSRGCP